MTYLLRGQRVCYQARRLLDQKAKVKEPSDIKAQVVFHILTEHLAMI